MNAELEQILRDGIQYHRVGNYAEAAARYNVVLNDDPANPGALYLMGDIAVRMGNNGVAVVLLNASVASKPSSEAYTALGVAHRNENRYGQAAEAWKVGLAIEPTAELYNNLSANYADHGQPELGLYYADAALAIDPDSPNAQWNKSLALLTDERWAEAWPLHEARFNPAVQSVSTRRNFGCPVWDGSRVKRLAVHGEQGIGDEIMFLSMLGEVMQFADEVVVEVEPRLMDLVERSFGVTTYGNEKAMAAHEEPFDATVALGSLGAFFRNAREDFPGTPYLKADPERVAYWRQAYKQQGPGPYTGVAWQGGTKPTRMHERTVHPHDLKFCKKGTAICLQYGDPAQVKQMAQDAGFVFYPESTGKDIDELAAMVAACDIIVTVPQTLVHVAGALGVACHVLTPLHSSWRYGTGTVMPWYGSVVLHRQIKQGGWAHPLAQVKIAIDKLCRSEKE